MKRVIGIVLIGIALAGCFGSSEPPTEAEKKVDQMETQMDAGTLPLHLNRSSTEAIIDYMGRSTDSQERGSGDLRLWKFRLGDGSTLVFALKPATGGGLVLDHFKAE